ncbi:ATP-dependent acyl-CoA ligase [Roseicella aquatilis]|uniref:ATP-dependent acyl-CoA ligase n=2 Tax=Roseicella aquatilis TaxID=2527868 RepID=A0A4R4DWF4_9PROT|nr:ATP-dependent acyl-CoA ligase [Roseicella aquatilis]
MPPLDRCVLRPLLERHARERPDKTCITFENGPSWTYRELRTRVAAVAAGLQGQGVRQGDHLLVWLPNGPEALLLWFAANWLGAVQVPLNISYRGRILEHVLGIADAALMVADAALLDRLRDAALPEGLRRIAVVGGTPRPFAGLEMIDAAAILGATGEPEPPPRPILPWDTQSMIYTSGTTGPSKGVLCSYMHYTSSGMAFPFVREEDRGLVTLPLFHMGGTGSVYRYLLRGASMVVAESFRTGTFWEVVRRHRITCASLLGAMTSFLVKAPPSPQDRDHTLRALTIVPLTEEAAAFRERFGVEVWTTFNMTEVACPIFSEANPTRIGSCGRPRPGITARIVDEHDCEVPVGAVGELVLRSAVPWSMNHGYHRNPEATARAWRNGWFHTGDAFRRDAAGEFFFVDRMKDAIRRRGENISSFEVEAEICAHPAVREAAVVAVPSEFAEDEVLAVVAPVPGASIDPRALIEFLAPRLPHFMVPRYLRILPELPKTLTAKVEKHLLRAEGLAAGTWDREQAGIRLRRERLSGEAR